MALSNKFGPMVLTTGNKSEMSVGYATLYGDMCGGYNVLKDVYKMQVFALSSWRNQHSPKGAMGPAGRVMPERVITKPPTAELRANQKDEDSLPPYAVLDDILECLVENEMPVEEIVKRGYDLAIVKRVEQLLSIAEYKRRQAPPGVKITRPQFRPRPPLSDHQRLPGRALTWTDAAKAATPLSSRRRPCGSRPFSSAGPSRFAAKPQRSPAFRYSDDLTLLVKSRAAFFCYECVSWR